jgi:large subunit ribosomal protein L23
MAVDKEKKAKKEPAVKKTTKKAALPKDAQLAYGVLLEPWITEKTHAAMGDNKYAFKVALDANKKTVTKAVEGLYGVSVEKVAIVNIHSKKRNYGRYVGKKSAIKKAIVTVKEGQSIELFRAA